MLRKKPKENGTSEERKGLLGGESKRSGRMESFEIEDNTPNETHSLLINKKKLTDNIIKCLITSSAAPAVRLTQAEEKVDREKKKHWPYKCDEKLLTQVIKQSEVLFGRPDFADPYKTAVTFFKTPVDEKNAKELARKQEVKRQTLIGYLCDSVLDIQSGKRRYT